MQHQQLPRTAQPPPDVPNSSTISPELTNYLRNFALWAKHGFADKVSASTAQPGHMLQANDTPSGASPPIYTLQVNSAGTVMVTPMSLGIGSPAGGGTPGGGGLPGGAGGGAAGSPIIIGGAANAASIHTATDSLNSTVSAGGLLQFDTINSDAGGFAPGSSPFTALTVPTGLAGTYSLMASASVAGDSTQTGISMGVLVNGSQSYATPVQAISAGAFTLTYTFTCVAALHLNLNAGDTVSLASNCNPGPNAFTGVTMSLARIT